MRRGHGAPPPERQCSEANTGRQRGLTTEDTEGTEKDRKSVFSPLCPLCALWLIPFLTFDHVGGTTCRERARVQRGAVRRYRMALEGWHLVSAPWSGTATF